MRYVLAYPMFVALFLIFWVEFKHK